MKAKLVVGSLLMVMIATMTFATPTSEEPMETTDLRVSWWGGDSRHQATLDAIGMFESKYPNISIEAEYSGFDGYYQKLVTQLVAKTAPDVFQSDQGWTVEFFNRGDVGGTVIPEVYKIEKAYAVGTAFIG